MKYSSLVAWDTMNIPYAENNTSRANHPSNEGLRICIANMTRTTAHGMAPQTLSSIDHRVREMMTTAKGT